jgi:hypothetical protein
MGRTESEEIFLGDDSHARSLVPNWDCCKVAGVIVGLARLPVPQTWADNPGQK